MVTILDVARAAGVGLGTASRALSGGGRVADATRRRVLDAAERLNYRPSRVARAFPRRRTHTLEILVPTFTRYFYFEILRGITDALAETDYSLVIRTIERVADRDRAFATCGQRGRADGALLVSLRPTDALIERLLGERVPVALVDAEGGPLPCTTVDHASGASVATQHCIALGHQRIALVDRAEDPLTPRDPGLRRQGYRRAMAEAGLDIPVGYERVEAFSPEAGGAALADLLTRPAPPTAVLAGSDTQAMGMLDTARRYGIRVPDDLSIVGYHDIELAQYLGLTTVRVPMRDLGRKGVELLLTAIEEPDAQPEHVHLPTELVVRRSCGPPPDGT